MTKVEITRFASSAALARAAARDWCHQIAEAQQPFTIALSGGRIANDFFREVAMTGRENHGLRNAHFFWADERSVPPDHADSNYRVARELLFEPLRIEPSHIHRVRGEDEPARAADDASEELLRVAGGEVGTARPALDWVFLGMGEDGHVASLFPGAEARSGIYYPVIGPKPPPQRITLSYDILGAAREVWVLVSGAGKEAALKESLRPEGETPLGRVLKSRKFTKIFSDFPVEGA